MVTYMANYILQLVYQSHFGPFCKDCPHRSVPSSPTTAVSYSRCDYLCSDRISDNGEHMLFPGLFQTLSCRQPLCPRSEHLAQAHAMAL